MGYSCKKLVAISPFTLTTDLFPEKCENSNFLEEGFGQK
jgi:hypothetical protein